MNAESTAADPPVGRIVSELKQVGEDALRQKDGISGIHIGADAHALVNDLARHPHAFVIGCIADRRVQADIAWRLPHKIREAAGDFSFETLLRLDKSVWSSVLASSGHPLASAMERVLPAAIRLIGDRYNRDAARIWAPRSSGATVARRFLAFDGVGPKIANMAVNLLISHFDVEIPPPMPDIAVDTHVLRVFERLGLLRSLAHTELSPSATKAKQRLRLQLRARELSPDWPGKLDWPTFYIGRTWCHAGRSPDCGRCCMNAVCPKTGVAQSVPHRRA